MRLKQINSSIPFKNRAFFIFRFEGIKKSSSRTNNNIWAIKNSIDDIEWLILLEPWDPAQNYKILEIT